jgi:oligogalacturonide lyase
MKLSHATLALLCLISAALVGADWSSTDAARQSNQEPPTDWIDPATGHRVIRLSKDPGTQSLYFHQQSYTEKGDKLVVNSKKGIAAIDLTTLGTAPCKVELITQSKGGGNLIVGKKSRQVYYIIGGSLWATHIDTKETRELAKLPKGYGQASGLALNADETLVASTATDPEGKEKANPIDKKDSYILPITGAKQKMTPGGRSLVMFTVNMTTGELKKIHYSTDWLNHTQFSPTDPEQILFCHEGTWDAVNRVRTIRADGSGEKLLHQRTMKNEIAGHEFFGFDGQTVWYDLQTPRSTVFWLAGVNLKTGERIRYPIERNQWSVHYNQSHDGKLFSGDGGGPNSVANRTLKGGKLDGPGNGQWMYLFAPVNDKSETIKVAGEDVKIGKLKVEKLVDMSKHNYTTGGEGGTEPNGTFTPDNKWVVFRSNMHGQTHVYAVEVAKPQAAKAKQAPADWIDPTTGHRVIRLSGPGGGSSLYFHQNTYTPEGDKLIFNSKGAIVAVDLAKLGVEPPKVEVVLEGASAIAMARKTREVYFSKKGKGGGIYAVHVDTHAVREVKNAAGQCINADETFSVGTRTVTDPTGNTPRPEPRKLLPQRERMFGDKIKLGIPLTPEEEKSAAKEEGLARKISNPSSQAFVFTDLKTGKATTVGYQYGWLNHLQFSPNDPNLLLYCHEGTWHEVDRVWTIRTDGSAMRLMHKRTMDMEIAGHEFWSYDGKIVWFDLQTPRSKEFWLAGVNVDTGDKIRYRIDRDEWSVHYNVSRDGKLFAGDGGDPGQVAFAKNGQWIYAFTPQPGETKVGEWREGKLKAEKLVNMATHKYTLEPNVTITPDGKWVVFRSNLQGASHVYAVEVKRS